MRSWVLLLSIPAASIILGMKYEITLFPDLEAKC
jgi:hypothetical protein